MKRFLLASILLLLPASLPLEVDSSPRKGNIVSNYLNKILEAALEELAKKNMTVRIGAVDLGEGVGRFSDVVGAVEGELKKKVDGITQYGFVLDGEVERVVAEGRYDLEYLDVPMLFPVFGKGSFSVTLEGVRLGVNLEAVYNWSTEQMDIKLPRLEINVRKAKVRLENLMNNPSVADFLNELISNLVPDLVTMISQPILNALKPEIAKYANGIILCVKNELLNHKVEECIADLFKPTDPILEKLFQATREALAHKLNNLSPPLPLPSTQTSSRN